jgi:ATP-dependent helicase Lhr and Lhr-like helicase
VAALRARQSRDSGAASHAGSVKQVLNLLAMSGVLDEFHPAVRQWFTLRFGRPSRAQELGWPVIAEAEDGAGHDVLLCAPTGSGKTLAAFLWAINRLVVEAETGRLLDRISVLYVSPLKALANDIRINLEEPFTGVRGVASSSLDLGAIRAGLRTGDTPVGERAAMLRRPPQILVTTPESLFILLTSQRFREKLTAVRYVIVDELHAVAGNKRGAHLMLSLERLERMVRRSGAQRPIRIGLSATLNPIETLAAFLAGAEVAGEGPRIPRPVRIVRADEEPRHADLKIIAPGPELGSLATHQHWEAMYDALAALIQEHRTTLIFTLSRRWAERIALALQKRAGANAVMAHHGSLARAERLAAEQRLKRGDLKAIVATASLELGIDVGAVELVCQIDSPKSISAAIQRIGRSGHSLSGTPKGRFFALTVDDLLECAAAVRAIRLRQLDEVEVPGGCLDVAAQQIVALAANEDEITETELLSLLRSTGNFAALDLAGLQQLLEQLSVQLPERIQGANPKIFYDRVSGRVRARRAARLAAITSGGTIPESGNLDVVIASEGRKIGDVEEDFAQESSRGDIFSLGSMPWRVLGISKNRFLVEPAPGMAPSLPFWQTEASGRSPALSASMCDLRRRIAGFLHQPNGGERAATEWLQAECSLDEPAATQTVAYIRRGLATLGAIPDEHTIVVERFFDGLGGTQVVLHTPFGIRFNRGFGLALRKRLCQSFDFEIQASAIDDAVLLALNSRHSFPLGHILSLVNSRNAREVLTQALLDSPMFEVRFRHVAARALAIMRSSRGRKVPAWIQRLRSQELITALFPQHAACFDNRPATITVPEHFIVQEAIRECLEETADVARLETILRRLEQGSVKTVLVDSVAPSVFAHRILLAWDYSFLDDGERANRRSRTVTMNRAMAEDVFRSENLAELLSTEAVEQVTAEIGSLAESARARNVDELYDLIRSHGALSLLAISERCAADAPTLVSSLDSQQRICRGRIGENSPELVIAVEDLPLFMAAYPDFHADLVGSDRQVADLSDQSVAVDEIVRRAMATSGPESAASLSARLHMPVQQVLHALIALEAKGSVFRGHFTRPPEGDWATHSDGPGQPSNEQWCDRYVLERIHRRTLNQLRSSVEPCSDEEFTAFRLAWQGIAREDKQGGVDRVRTVLQQFAGLAFAPELWEQAILPARVAGYRPEYLDLLCMSGEFAWLAAPWQDQDESDYELPDAVAFVPRKAISPWIPHAVPQDPQSAKVLAVLAKFGAQYLDQIAERANLPERDTLTALWHLAAAALVSNDSFAPLRLLAAEPQSGRIIAGRPLNRTSGRRDAALRARLQSSLSGRWSLVRPLEDDGAIKTAAAHEPQAADRTREFAAMLLKRNGIVSREMMAFEQLEMPWNEILFALRRMEYAGNIRRGWFVRSLSGEQYALPDALEFLRDIRQSASAKRTVTALSAGDPANPYGVLLPGCGISREWSNLLVFRDGRLLAGLAGRDFRSCALLNQDDFTCVLRTLMKLRPRLVIETIDHQPALESERAIAMAAMRFHSDGRALIYDGLPGPMPARAAAALSERG